MRRIESIEDQMRGIVTFEVGDGRYVALDRREVQEHGAAAVLRHMGYGHLLPTERVAVMQQGERIGTLPPDFEPMAIRSTTVLYDPRPGDFTRESGAWIADERLGPGDLDAVPGWRWDRS